MHSHKYSSFIYWSQIVFIDVDPETMNIDLNDLKKITSKTKAIVCVDYGGVLMTI